MVNILGLISVSSTQERKNYEHRQIQLSEICASVKDEGPQ